MEDFKTAVIKLERLVSDHEDLKRKDVEDFLHMFRFYDRQHTGHISGRHVPCLFRQLGVPLVSTVKARKVYPYEDVIIMVSRGLKSAKQDGKQERLHCFLTEGKRRDLDEEALTKYLRSVYREHGGTPSSATASKGSFRSAPSTSDLLRTAMRSTLIETAKSPHDLGLLVEEVVDAMSISGVPDSADVDVFIRKYLPHRR